VTAKETFLFVFCELPKGLKGIESSFRSGGKDCAPGGGDGKGIPFFSQGKGGFSEFHFPRFLAGNYTRKLPGNSLEPFPELFGGRYILLLRYGYAIYGVQEK
jgi:hypothetical protein